MGDSHGSEWIIGCDSNCNGYLGTFSISRVFIKIRFICPIGLLCHFRLRENTIFEKTFKRKEREIREIQNGSWMHP